MYLAIASLVRLIAYTFAKKNVEIKRKERVSEEEYVREDRSILYELLAHNEEKTISTTTTTTS